MRFSRVYMFGLEHGKQQIYHENGKIRERSQMAAGKYQGEYRGYYKEYVDGTLQKICYYQDGLLQGDYQGFYPSGNMMVRCNYENDNLEGEWIKYFDLSKPDSLEFIQEKGVCRKGKKTGLWKTYYPTGQVYTEGAYLNRKFEGSWKIYHPNGQLKQKGDYKEGLATGEFQLFYESGNLVETLRYENGEEIRQLDYCYSINPFTGNIL